MSPSPQNAPMSMWQSASTEARFSPASVCAKRAGTFEQKVRIRNAIEYVAGGFVTVLFTGLTIAAIIKGELWIAFSAVMIIAGIAVVLWNLRNQASNLERRPEDACLQHLRRQYQRQFTAIKAVPRWYIGPFIPGIVLFYGVITARVAEVAGWARAIEGIAGPVAITFGMFAAIILFNWIAARSLKRQIDAMDALA